MTESVHNSIRRNNWNAFSVPMVAEKIVATGGEGREWRQERNERNWIKR